MVLTKQHWAGISLSGTGILSFLLLAVKWLTSNLTVPAPGSLLISGLPIWLTAGVITFLSLLAPLGAFILLIAPSVSDKVNQKAGFEANRRLSTVPPPAPPSSNPNPPGAAA